MYPSKNNHNNNVHKSDLTDEFMSISLNNSYPIINASNSNNITIFSDYTGNNNVVPNVASVLQSYVLFNDPKLQCFESEIKINIFKYVEYPLNLALTCRSWSVIAKNPYAKIEWFLEHYGKTNALFNAVKLGRTFIDTSVWQILVARKIISSINNGDALNHIAGLPQQVVNDSSLINQFFNGSFFI